MKLEDFLLVAYALAMIAILSFMIKFADEADELQHQLDSYDYGCGYIEEPIEEQPVEKDDVDVVRNSKGWEI